MALCHHMANAAKNDIADKSMSKTVMSKNAFSCNVRRKRQFIFHQSPLLCSCLVFTV